MPSPSQAPTVKHIFFGTDQFSVGVLDALVTAGQPPTFIVTTPDTKQGKHLVLTPPAVKTWAQKHQIPCIQVSDLTDPEFVATLISQTSEDTMAYTLASFGKIIPVSILDLPTNGMLNVHPSLLPLLRGASPLETAILTLDKTGVSIMLMDEKMDHGPVVTQTTYKTNAWPVQYATLRDDLASQGGQLLAEVLPQWINQKISLTHQDHTQATFTKKFVKNDGRLDLNDDPITNLRKVRAFSTWPKAFVELTHNKKPLRIVILDANIEAGKFVPSTVIPAGKKIMSYESFKNGYGDLLTT